MRRFAIVTQAASLMDFALLLVSQLMTSMRMRDALPLISQWIHFSPIHFYISFITFLYLTNSVEYLKISQQSCVQWSCGRQEVEPKPLRAEVNRRSLSRCLQWLRVNCPTAASQTCSLRLLQQLNTMSCSYEKINNYSEIIHFKASWKYKKGVEGAPVTYHCKKQERNIFLSIFSIKKMLN